MSVGLYLRGPAENLWYVHGDVPEPQLTGWLCTAINVIAAHLHADMGKLRYDEAHACSLTPDDSHRIMRS
ncbi:MAG: hypothetical protein NVSMB52_19130 [Chloroflexota bacterium]